MNRKQRRAADAQSRKEAIINEVVVGVTKTLIDERKIIETGWLSLKAAYLHPEAPEEQVSQMRAAFFAGAQHLYSSIMVTLDPGGEPTEDDLGRMAAIDDELREFIADFELRQLPTKGSA